MLRNFNFDYDPENDSLFLYDPNSKSNSSIELGDLIIDFNNQKQVSGIELLNASDFFKDLDLDDVAIDKNTLKGLKECKINIITKNNNILIKFIFIFKHKKKLTTSTLVPAITEPSPALATV